MKPANRESHFVHRDDVNGTLFTIDQEDMSFIFNILRNNMYSDPIKIVIQEYMCNARDAHREVGKARIPIEVHLPDSSDSCFFEVRDYGKGMDYETMVNVFCKYGKSTKRDTNQTGGFGIGAKSAWAYRDDFRVSVFQDGIKTTYFFYIDETQCGKMIVELQEKTSEEDGTLIHVDVREDDRDAFINKFNYITYFWGAFSPKQYQKFKYPPYSGGNVDIEGDNFTLYNQSWSVYYSSLVVVDGIPYPINTMSIENLRKDQSKLCDYNLVINAGMTDVDVAANRENLNYTAKTQKWILSQLDLVLDHIKSVCEQEINSYKNFWSVQCDYQNRKGMLKFARDLKITDMEYNNIPIDAFGETNSKISFVCDETTHEDSDNHTKFYRYLISYNGRGSLRKADTQKIRWNKNEPIVVIKTKSIPLLKLKKLIQNYEFTKDFYEYRIDALQLIVLPSDPHLQEVELKSLNEKFFLEKLVQIDLNDIKLPKPKKMHLKQTTGAIVTLIKRDSYSLHEEKVEIDVDEVSGYYILSSRKTIETHTQGTESYKDYENHLKYIMEIFNIKELYLLPSRFKNKAKNNSAFFDFWQQFHQYIKEIDHSEIDQAFIDQKRTNFFIGRHWRNIGSNLIEISVFLPKDHIIRKYINYSDNTGTLTKRQFNLIGLSRYITNYNAPKNISDEGDVLFSTILQRYPMLAVLDAGCNNLFYNKAFTVINNETESTENTLNRLASDYINAIDKG
jgi:hypothetical protein